MQIRADALLPYARDLVFAAYRDRLAETTEHLPNIVSIDVVSREDAPGIVKFVNEWTAGGDIPKVARAVIGESMLKWTDYATWREREHEVDWRTDVHAFPGAVKSAGTNRFVAEGESTRLEIRGELTIEAAKIPGVPRLLGKTVAQAVERFLAAQIEVNSIAVANAVGKLLRK